MKTKIKQFFKTFFYQIGVFLLVATMSSLVLAAWNSRVNSNDTLTASKWNSLVSKVEELENKQNNPFKDFEIIESRYHNPLTGDQICEWVNKKCLISLLRGVTKFAKCENVLVTRSGSGLRAKHHFGGSVICYD
jgi:hypothetical protein